MIFELSGAGPISRAELEVGGVTVLTGPSGTGKSTLLRALYAVTETYAGLRDTQWYDALLAALEAVDWESRPDLEVPGYGTLEDVPRQLDELLEGPPGSEELARIVDAVGRAVYPGNEPIRRAERLLRGDVCDGYASDRMAKLLAAEFGKGRFGPAGIGISDGGGTLDVHVVGDGSVDVSGPVPDIPRVVLIDSSPVMNSSLGRPSDHRVDLLRLLMRRGSREDDDASLHDIGPRCSQSDAYEWVLRLLDGIVPGDVGPDSYRDRLVYSEGGTEAEFENMPDGLKVFGILKALLSNGMLPRGSLVLMDAPEANLHPNLQKSLAEILVGIAWNLGIDIVVTTHSPIILLGIQTASYSYYDLDLHCYSLGRDGDGTVRCTDATGNLERVYSEFESPRRELDGMRFEF